jgi:hypothetical protein
LQVVAMDARWFIYFRTKNPNNDAFFVIWNIFRTFGIFYDHLRHFVFVRYIFSGFGVMYKEKSGNPGGGGSAFFCRKFKTLSNKMLRKC